MFPKRQLDPSARVRNYIGQKSGSDQGSRAAVAGSISLRGGYGAGSTPTGTTSTVETLPTDPNEVLPGRIYEVLGAEGESSRLVTTVRMPDGSFQYRDVIQHVSEWNAVYLSGFGEEGTGNGQFTDGIRGIAVRPDTGAVYVSSGTGATSKVQKFSANGTYVSTIATYGTGNGQVNTPWGLWYHPNFFHAILVADSGNNRRQTFVNDVYSSQMGGYTAPRAIQAGHFSAVVNTGLHQVTIFSHVLGGPTPGVGPLEWDTPTGMAQLYIPGSPKAFYWVADTNNHRVQALAVTNADVTLRYLFGSLGTGKGQFNTPDSIAIDAQGNIYVTDSLNHRVQVFDSAGIFQGSFGSFGTGDGKFNTPTGIAISEDYIYVCDSGNHRVQIFANPLPVASFIVGEAETAYAGGAFGAGGVAQITLTVPGAMTSDYAEVAYTNQFLTHASFNIFAKITAANTVAVVFANNSGTGSLSSGTVKVRVSR